MKATLASGILALALPTLAFAHGNTIDATNDSVVEVLKIFKATESDATKAAFRGIKAWPKDDSILAKVYFISGQNEISLNYMCMMEHSGGNDKMTCHKQQ